MPNTTSAPTSSSERTSACAPVSWSAWSVLPGHVLRLCSLGWLSVGVRAERNKKPLVPEHEGLARRGGRDRTYATRSITSTSLTHDAHDYTARGRGSTSEDGVHAGRSRIEHGRLCVTDCHSGQSLWVTCEYYRHAADRSGTATDADVRLRDRRPRGRIRTRPRIPGRSAMATRHVAADPDARASAPPLRARASDRGVAALAGRAARPGRRCSSVAAGRVRRADRATPRTALENSIAWAVQRAAQRRARTPTACAASDMNTQLLALGPRGHNLTDGQATTRCRTSCRGEAVLRHAHRARPATTGRCGRREHRLELADDHRAGVLALQQLMYNETAAERRAPPEHPQPHFNERRRRRLRRQRAPQGLADHRLRPPLSRAAGCTATGRGTAAVSRRRRPFAAEPTSFAYLRSTPKSNCGVERLPLRPARARARRRRPAGRGCGPSCRAGCGRRPATSAIGPPSAASGAMCPMHSPVVPPEKRPSVSSRTSLPSPAPLIAPVICEHLAHARAALRALPADDDDVVRPAAAPAASASIAACSRSKTRAVPSKTSASKPALLTTAPSGASEPAQDRQAAGAVDRVGQRVDDLAVRVGRGDVGEVLGHASCR